MADLIQINWAAADNAVTMMLQYAKTLDDQASEVQAAFVQLAGVWQGGAHDGAVAHAQRIQQARTNLNQTLQLLAQGIRTHRENVYAMDQQQAVRIGGV